MRRPLLFLVYLTLLGVSLAAVPDTYFPHAPGTAWHYSGGEVQQALLPTTLRGVRVVPLSHSFGTQLVSLDYLEYRGGGVYLRGVQAGGARGRLSWYLPPLTVYPPGPLMVGQSWSSESGGLRLGGQVVGSQAITSAYGSFNALLIRTETLAISAAVGAVARAPSVQYVYFVPGLGAVRYQTADGSTVDLLK
ncbi:hypothetical protein [Deinococcus sp.]|uniref:hypothetical protein n=1 Tax=Deinococcus sp. TaxID=47478 RepID=UPI003CC56A50